MVLPHNIERARKAHGGIAAHGYADHHGEGKERNALQPVYDPYHINGCNSHKGAELSLIHIFPGDAEALRRKTE